MSDIVDRIIDTHLTQRPGARHAYQHDPTMHHDIERTRSLLAVVEAAMQREGIPYDSAERVLNEVVHVGLDGWEREKLSRERDLLLTTFDPSEFGRPSSAVFTEHGDITWGPGTPPHKEGAVYRKPERPVGSEEKTT